MGQSDNQDHPQVGWKVALVMASLYAVGFKSSRQLSQEGLSEEGRYNMEIQEPSARDTEVGCTCPL